MDPHISQEDGWFSLQDDQSQSGTEADGSEPEKDSFQQYPSTKPFINDDYHCDPSKPLMAYPESNRQAVMSALRGLQEKIRRLELERSQAEENLRTLAGETARYRNLVTQPSLDVDSLPHADPNISHASTLPANISQQAKDVQGKLDTAEHRCDLLERQLNYMRRLVAAAETERGKAVQRATTLQTREDDGEQQQLDKLSRLEREHLQLTATQTVTQNKIRDLEALLHEEKKHRKHLQEKTAQWESASETRRILEEATDCSQPKKLKRRGSRKKKTSAKAPPKSYQKKPGMEPPEHYRLNLREVPFVTGQSTSKSHSLAANFQQVLSLMKMHNNKLCGSPRLGSSRHVRNRGMNLLQKQPSSSSSGISSGSEELTDLTQLLLQLQDEFGHLSLEHQELSRQLAEAQEPQVRDDLERELDTLVCSMETKGNQIARLRKFQEKVHAPKKKKVPTATLR